LFQGNSASDTGAVGCANWGTTFRRCTFIENTTPTVASAINIRINTTVDGCTFINNYAGERGAIATTGFSSNIIKNSVFIDNKSAISASSILFESAEPYDLSLSNLTFINNEARSIGGAMYASGAGTISFDGIYSRGGYAGNGGLLAIAGTGSPLTVNIKNADVEGMLGTQGGAFHISGGAALNINSSTISNNEAIATGGAFYVDGSSTVTLRTVTAAGNLARYGGLVSFSLLAAPGCDFSIINSNLNNNTATNGGGVFWSEDDVPACTSSLVGTTNNGASGGSYGNLQATPPHSVRLEARPPTSIAPSKVFTAILSVLDFYNQTVRNNKNFVGEVTIVSATGNATFGGVSREDITANGTVSFQLLRINARPGTSLLVDFHTLPRLSRSEFVNITITPCEAGFEEYITDGVYYCLRTVDTTSATQIALAIIAGVLSFACVVLFFVLFKNMDSPIIRAASPLFCLSIVFGGLLTCAAAFMFLWNTDATCALRPWFYALGFMIIYGSLFVKEFRMFRIFNANLTKPLRISNQQLFGMIGAGLVVELAILIGWYASGPYIRIPRVDDLIRVTEPAITYECSTKSPAAFWVLVGFNLLLLTVCSVIAFLTRNLPDTLNESKGLAFSIYNCTLTMVVCLVIAGVLYSPTAVSLVGSIGILFSTSVTLGAIFLPKLWLALRKDAVIQSIREDIAQLKGDIEWKERQIVEIERGFRGESSASKDTSMTAGSTRMASAAPSGVVSGGADSDSDSDSSSSEVKPKRVAKKAGSGKKAAAKKAPADSSSDSDSDSEEEKKPAKKSAKKAASPKKAEPESDSESEEKPAKKSAKKSAKKAAAPKKAESESDSESEKKPAKKPAKESSSDSSASEESS
jgi:predicted outer membrane repeat protein